MKQGALMKPVSVFVVAIFALSATANASEFAVLYTNQVNNVDDIYMVLPSGEHRKVTNNRRKDSSPVVSSNGRFIAFTSERVGWWKIWKLDLSDGSFTQLTDSTSAEYAPSWSPSGDQLAFVSSRDGDADIFVMDSDGSNLRNISNNQTDDASPYWHQDNRIYFSSSVDGTLQIVSVRIDGTNRQVHSSGSMDKLMPQVSPVRDEVLFYGEADGNTDIYVMSLSGDSIRRLTNDPLMDMRARWSPDGEQIVFERGDKRRNQHIYLMNRNGDGERKLTTSGYNYSAAFVGNCDYLCAEN